LEENKKMNLNRIFLRYGLVLMVVCLLGTVSFAQDKDKEYKYEFCSDNNWSNGDKVSANDLREITIAAPSILNVNSKNGRITVKGENRSDVLVRACVQAWAESKGQADSIVKSIRIETASGVRAENTPEENWSVSYEIHVPNRSNLDLMSQNGRITIESVQGQMKFETHNGRITLDDVAGDIKGMTRNGRVTVKLSGTYWQGSGLDVETNNGRITLDLPSSYAANVYVSTTNGRFSSNFAELQVAADSDGRKRRGGANKVSASINGGGAPIRLVTHNGRVSINSN
jgi:DUF4097 and DUF4098 domain-containing protein YvlB